MEVSANIKGIKYEVLLADFLKEFNIANLDINDTPPSFILNTSKQKFAVSKWLSPKRTRSYPYERVYNTLALSKKITVIPIIKDEGKNGDRDFLQWDTISLMSLLDVYFIPAYYDSAEALNGKITNQKFNNEYIISKINEIEKYHSSALHWNLNEIYTNLHNLIDIVKFSYQKIENTTCVKLHNFRGLDRFKDKIGNDVSTFMTFSREKSIKAQTRELLTTQPKEILSTLSKSKITISNYLGGQYFLTVDEISIIEGNLNLIESKHTRNSFLPSKSDIKDGLLKMILYSNLSDVKINGNIIHHKPLLNLTSSKIQGTISSGNLRTEIAEFIMSNKFTTKEVILIDLLFSEAAKNQFIIRISNSR